MKKPMVAIASFFAVCLFGIVAAQGNPLAVDSILKSLKDYEKAWNRKDAKQVIAYYHDNAAIMTGGERKYVTKKEYLTIVPLRFKYGKMKFHKPKIAFKENKAVVHVKASFKKFHVNYTFVMLPAGDQWLIRVQEY